VFHGNCRAIAAEHRLQDKRSCKRDLDDATQIRFIVSFQKIVHWRVDMRPYLPGVKDERKELS